MDDNERRLCALDRAIALHGQRASASQVGNIIKTAREIDRFLANPAPVTDDRPAQA